MSKQGQRSFSLIPTVFALNWAYGDAFPHAKLQEATELILTRTGGESPQFLSVHPPPVQGEHTLLVATHLFTPDTMQAIFAGWDGATLRPSGLREFRLPVLASPEPDAPRAYRVKPEVRTYGLGSPYQCFTRLFSPIIPSRDEVERIAVAISPYHSMRVDFGRTGEEAWLGLMKYVMDTKGSVLAQERGQFLDAVATVVLNDYASPEQRREALRVCVDPA